jgi:ABC-type multidrug transport system permease subunit
MTLMIAMFASALPSLIVFPEERPVFLREYSTNHYNVFSYFLSRLGLEAFLTAVQMLLVAIVTYFMIDFQLSFGWHFIILYSLAMASTAIAMVLGSSVEDTKLAVEFLPMCLVPQILLSGFFIASELIPVWLRWLQNIMPFTYAVRIYMVQEFDDCAETTAVCQNLLDRNNINPDDVWWYWLALLGLFVVLRTAAFVLLRRKANKYF